MFFLVCDLNSLSDISLLVYKTANNFQILILYPDTLLNLCISLIVFWWNLHGSLYIICHLQILTVLLLAFQFGRPLFFFFLIVVAWISNTMSNRSGESGHSHLVADHKENNFSFYQLTLILAVVYYIWLLLC